MKLHAELLKKFIELPTNDLKALRIDLDSLGLEVKDLDEEKGIFNIETLANRGDHLYHLGVAREIAGRFLSPIKIPHLASELPSKKLSTVVRIQTKTTPAFSLLELEVPSGFSAPAEVRNMIEPKADRHPLVDILNYAQLELGQPMHAYDRDKIEGEISVVLSTEPEDIIALDGKKYTVPSESILIRDSKKIIGVAGVIGCANTMMTSSTTRVFLEAAAFCPVHVRKTAKKMGLSTEASYAFERGTDQSQILSALKRVLVLAESESQSARAIALFYEAADIEERVIVLSLKNLKKQLNAARLPDVEISARLKGLGFHSEISGDELKVIVPSWRLWDVSNKDDITEEVARARGLSEIKIELPPLDEKVPEKNQIEVTYEKAGITLSCLGFTEVITRSFFPVKYHQVFEKLGGKREHLVTLLNSVEAENAALKSNNIFHIGNIIQQNLKSGETSAKVFEIGRIFQRESKKDFDHEEEVLTFAVAGRFSAENWKEAETRQEKLQRFLGVLNSVLASFGRIGSVREGNHSFLHPQAQGEVFVGKKSLGIVGLLHPEIQGVLETKEDIFVAQLSVKALVESGKETTIELPSDYPSITRDLTFFVPLKTFAGKLKSILEKEAPEFLKKVEYINEFKKDDEDLRRCSYRITFQHKERTLQHDEVDVFIGACVGRAKEKGFELV